MKGSPLRSAITSRFSRRAETPLSARRFVEDADALDVREFRVSEHRGERLIARRRGDFDAELGLRCFLSGDTKLLAQHLRRQHLIVP